MRLPSTFTRATHPLAAGGKRPELSFGTVALGNMNRAMPADQARATLRHAYQKGFRIFDTAPLYGHGLAEYRLAAEFLERPRETYSLITKVGRTLSPERVDGRSTAPWVDVPPMRLSYDYSYDGVMRQVEDSMTRLGVSWFDALLVHDIDIYTHGDNQPERFREAIEGAFKALLTLRDQGVARAIGVGVNESDVCLATMDRVDIDCILLAGEFNLLDTRASERLLPRCLEGGVEVINGRVFGSGVLATGTGGTSPIYNYRTADPAIVRRVSGIETVCQRHEVPLGAVSLAFAGRHPGITNICVGARTPGQIDELIAWHETPIPEELWAELADAALLPS